LALVDGEKIVKLARGAKFQGLSIALNVDTAAIDKLGKSNKAPKRFTSLVSA
jgi:hypothetical protein